MRPFIILLLMTTSCSADQMPTVEEQIKEIQKHVDILAHAIENIDYEIEILSHKGDK